MKPKLAIVTDEPQPRIDIYANWRAEIRTRDWAAMHIRADRREPVALGDTRKGWAR